MALIGVANFLIFDVEQHSLFCVFFFLSGHEQLNTTQFCPLACTNKMSPMADAVVRYQFWGQSKFFIEFNYQGWILSVGRMEKKEKNMSSGFMGFS